MDAISALAGGMRSAHATVNAAAQQIAAADVPTNNGAELTAPTGATAPTDVDVAQQLTTLMVAVDAHHLTVAAMHVALSTYRAALSLDLNS